MSYLEEWDRIEQMIENHNISKSTIVPPEKRQALALMHIAKCLSVFADDVANTTANVDSIRRCGECIHQGDTEHCASCQIIFNVTGFELVDHSKCVESVTCDKNTKEATEAKPCNKCIYSNDEYELNCSVCDEWHSEYKPFGFRGKDEEIEVTCPVCARIITVKKITDVLDLMCPSCGAKFLYDVDSNEYESYID